ncbi:tetratricopeptide repeat protein [Kordiimonas sp.]|uniref:tetratricopeptide repeat protein n=1 Tax=Kordiimonas sp. TaxID=1970157 RepID=UPI003A9333E3
MYQLIRPVLFAACALGFATAANADRLDSGSAMKFEIVMRASESLARAHDLILTGDSAGARKIYERTLDNNLTTMQLARVHNGLCVTYIMDEEWESAMKHCDNAIRIVPNNWRFYNNRGNIYLETGDFDRAYEQYKEGLRFAPRSMVIQHNIDLADGRRAGNQSGKPQDARPT